eukprot:TRINITY_DN6832_c0_g2_i1.p1 TRINITY_DN6832_c0_g2~~TRINITY_DN6832_c0_g2_i1.p1  ORF type:complete len:2007 (+),score=400.72 TRINITY_DN6832_c0_g2_i1:620-6022(+)
MALRMECLFYDKRETYRCAGQPAAAAVCRGMELKLCSISEMKEQIGPVCRYMWTEDSSGTAFRFGNGSAGCGEEDKLYAEIASENGQGMFDAACCEKPPPPPPPLPKEEIVAEINNFKAIAHGGCATAKSNEPDTYVRKDEVNSSAICRSHCDKDEGCAAYSWGNENSTAHGACYLYQHDEEMEVEYDRGNGKRGMICWKKLEVANPGLVDLPSNWMPAKEVVIAANASSEKSFNKVKEVLKDDDMYWMSNTKAATLTFEMMGSTKISGMRFRVPPRFAGVALREYEIAVGTDGQEFDIIKRGNYPNTRCCEFAEILWSPTSWPFWQLRIISNWGSMRSSIQYIEFLVAQTQLTCRDFFPNLRMFKVKPEDFHSTANVALQAYGGAPFGSGSFALFCTHANEGSGLGEADGPLCYRNINDGHDGGGSAWRPGHLFNGKHFVGVTLAGHRMVHGISITTPPSFAENIGGEYIIQYAGIRGANHLTPDLYWCTVGSFRRKNARPIYWKFTEAINATALRLIVTNMSVVLDEFKIFAELEPLPVTKGLIVDVRAATFKRTASLIGNNAIEGQQIFVSHEIDYDKDRKALHFFRGGPTLKIPVYTDAVEAPNATMIAWVRLPPGPDAEEVRGPGAAARDAAENASKPQPASLLAEDGLKAVQPIADELNPFGYKCEKNMKIDKAIKCLDDACPLKNVWPLEKCADHCNDNEGCLAFELNNKQECYLKTDAVFRVVDKSQDATTTCKEAPPIGYECEDDVAFVPTPMDRHAVVSNLSLCAAFCEITAGCKGFTYNASSQCDLRYVIGEKGKPNRSSITRSCSKATPTPNGAESATKKRVSVRFTLTNVLFKELEKEQLKQLHVKLRYAVAMFAKIPMNFTREKVEIKKDKVQVFIDTFEPEDDEIMLKMRLAGVKFYEAVGKKVNEIPDIYPKLTGLVMAQRMTAYSMLASAEFDTGSGWIASQVPDFGKSRALVLRDWRGELTINAGQEWSSKLGKAPKDAFFMLTGVWTQGKDKSFAAINDKVSPWTVAGANTGADKWIVLENPLSARCLSVEYHGNSLLWNKNCAVGDGNNSWQWIEAPSLKYPGAVMLKHFSGRCARSCIPMDEPAHCSRGNDARTRIVKLALDECRPDDSKYHFVHLHMHGLFQVKQRHELPEPDLCLRPQDDQRGNGTSVVLDEACFIDDVVMLNETRRLKFETLSIGGKEDYDSNFNPEVLISDVFVFNRSLDIREIEAIYNFGRPSAPIDYNSICPKVRDDMSLLCQMNDVKPYCEYNTALRKEDCATFCKRTGRGELECLNSFEDEPVGTCERRTMRFGIPLPVKTDNNTNKTSSSADDGPCQVRRDHQVCQCKLVTTTTTTFQLAGSLFYYGAGRDRLPYRQLSSDMTETSRWQVAGPCCIQAVAASDTHLYAVNTDFVVVRMPYISLGQATAMWEVMSKCCVISITIDHEAGDIYGITKEKTVVVQPFKTLGVDTIWEDAGSGSVTSLAIVGDDVYATGSYDGHIYMQSKANMRLGRRWPMISMGGFSSLLAVSDEVGMFIYGTGTDFVPYRIKTQGLDTLHAVWEVVAGCCMQSLASFKGTTTTTTALTTTTATTWASWQRMALEEGSTARRCVGGPDAVYEFKDPTISLTECLEAAQNPPFETRWFGGVRFYSFCHNCTTAPRCVIARYCEQSDHYPGKDWATFANTNSLCPDAWRQDWADQKRMTKICEGDNFVVEDELACQEKAHRANANYYQYCRNCEFGVNWCCHQMEECACYSGIGWRWRAYMYNHKAGPYGWETCPEYDWGDTFEGGGEWKPEHGR